MGTPHAETDPVVQALIFQGVDYCIGEDKAFMAKDLKAEGIAHGGLEATVKALALVMGTDLAHAHQTILTAL